MALSLAVATAGCAVINPATPPSYMIRGIPTLLLFKDGDLKETVVGLTDKSELARMIDRHLS